MIALEGSFPSRAFLFETHGGWVTVVAPGPQTARGSLFYGA